MLARVEKTLSEVVAAHREMMRRGQFRPVQSGVKFDANKDSGTALPPLKLATPHGAELSLRIAREALERLPRGGGLVLYTATAIVDGEDLLLRALLPHLRGARFDYRELDPDVFGEELDRSAYRNVERIAVVALDAIKE